jgi:hypothetical protein
MDCFTSDASSSSGASSPSPATTSAASRPNEPAKAPRRAKNVRWGTDSSSKLQATAARSVCCRSATSVPPSTSSSKRSWSRARMAAGLSRSVRAAASSIASGSPSNAAHTAAMSAATASSTSRSGATAVARSTNSLTAACAVISRAPAASGGGRSRGGTGHANSPETPSGRRLVASTRTAGPVRNAADAT